MAVDGSLGHGHNGPDGVDVRAVTLPRGDDPGR